MAALTQAQKLSPQTFLRALIAPVVLFLLIFVSAGRFDYWQGWLYIVSTSGVLLVTVFAMRRNPQLIEERLNPGQGVKPWDKWYFALSTPLYIGGLILASLDTGRFGWSPELPLWVYGLSILLFLAGQGLFLWAKVSNRYFSSVVRIQTERGQTVCREGPYRYVRHPGYVGSFVWTLAAPLLFGSLWAMLPAVLSVVLLAWRTVREDETLQQELPGYAEYARQVKYRLVPNLW
jgi:protein-S-isoprenylcysteine O-methyltransferase Ste14